MIVPLLYIIVKHALEFRFARKGFERNCLSSLKGRNTAMMAHQRRMAKETCLQATKGQNSAHNAQNYKLVPTRRKIEVKRKLPHKPQEGHGNAGIGTKLKARKFKPPKATIAPEIGIKIRTWPK